ncbi:motility protein A [Clostridium senegalense]|uniref:motility protein A n=1 Tax=Clostridium senegalense TaxID=1465809 RepID=UPI00028899F3|nr:motility protein A [Clostridium senegalense]
MKKNDMLTIIGLIVAWVLVIYGIMDAGGNAKIYIDVASIAITGGGSIGAVLISYEMKDIKRLGKVIGKAFKEDANSKTDIVLNFTEMSRKARREGLLSLEDDISSIENPFTKKALSMVVDGIEPEAIKEIMALEIEQLETRHSQGSAMLKSWGAYAPAFGMCGTLIGLIQMLSDMNDADALTKGMGAALITTFYGSLIANLIALPIAAKLDNKTALEVANMEMIVEGVIAIQSGANPRIVEDKLLAYLSPAEKETFKVESGGEVENG